MKKVMFAAAVAASMVAFGDITSQNVVGYATTGAIKGFKIMGAQFAGVGTEKAIDLTDVKVTGYTAPTQAQVYMQVLDSVGRGGMTYYYYDVPGEFTGWADSFDNPVEPGQVMIQPGSGYWTNAPGTDWAIQTAGEVPTSDIAVGLIKGFRMIVNSTPVPMDVAKIGVTGYTAPTQAQVYMQVLDSVGRGGMTYYYYDVPGEFTGWADSFDNPVEPGQVMLQPGEGYWTNAPGTEWTLVLPGAELQ